MWYRKTRMGAFHANNANNKSSRYILHEVGGLGYGVENFPFSDDVSRKTPTHVWGRLRS